MAGMCPEDMELALVYDSFIVTAGITVEMLGLAPRGEGCNLWKDGHASPGGRLPINTNGGAALSPRALVLYAAASSASLAWNEIHALAFSGRIEQPEVRGVGAVERSQLLRLLRAASTSCDLLRPNRTSASSSWLRTDIDFATIVCFRPAQEGPG